MNGAFQNVPFTNCFFETCAPLRFGLIASAQQQNRTGAMCRLQHPHTTALVRPSVPVSDPKPKLRQRAPARTVKTRSDPRAETRGAAGGGDFLHTRNAHEALCCVSCDAGWDAAKTFARSSRVRPPKKRTYVLRLLPAAIVIGGAAPSPAMPARETTRKFPSEMSERG